VSALLTSLTDSALVEHQDRDRVDRQRLGRSLVGEILDVGRPDSLPHPIPPAFAEVVTDPG
jgi:hypothetical protein